MLSGLAWVTPLFPSGSVGRELKRETQINEIEQNNTIHVLKIKLPLEPQPEKVGQDHIISLKGLNAYEDTRFE